MYGLSNVNLFSKTRQNINKIIDKKLISNQNYLSGVGFEPTNPLGSDP